MDINNEDEEIKEGMAEIDEKLKEIEDFNKRNYKIDESYLELYEDIFDMLDKDIVEAPHVEYKEDNVPSYYPKNGIWFNNEDVSVSIKNEFDEEDLEELKKLEEEESL